MFVGHCPVLSHLSEVNQKRNCEKKFTHRIHLSFYRSANYYKSTGVCELSEMDRITLAGSNSFQPNDGKYTVFFVLFACIKTKNAI